MHLNNFLSCTFKFKWNGLNLGEFNLNTKCLHLNDVFKHRHIFDKHSLQRRCFLLISWFWCYSLSRHAYGMFKKRKGKTGCNSELIKSQWRFVSTIKKRLQITEVIKFVIIQVRGLSSFFSLYLFAPNLNNEPLKWLAVGWLWRRLCFDVQVSCIISLW